MLRVLLESEMLPEQLLELLLGHPSYFELDQKYKNRLFLFYMNCTIKQLTPNSSSRKAYEMMQYPYFVVQPALMTAVGK